MRRLSAALALAFVGCGSCGKTEAKPEAGAETIATAALVPAPLSLPIAAAVASDGAVFVAGYVAARKAAILERHEGPRVTFVTDVASELAWSPDLELRVLADTSGGGVVIVRSSSARILRRFDSRANLGASRVPGGAVCATERGLAEVDTSGDVTLRAWSGEELGRMPAQAERDPTLVCAKADAFVLLEGDDVLLGRIPPKGPPTRIVADTDDERERAPFTANDMLGLVEVTRAGALSVTRVRANPEITRLKSKLGEDDDLESVDGDEHVAYLAISHDASSRCAQGAATDLTVLRAAQSEREIDVLKGECGKDLGPYRVDTLTKGAVVAWAERAPKKAPSDAPIDGVSWARVDEVAEVGHVPAQGEGVVFAGCVGDRCYAVVLERPAGTDGMRPGLARVIAYP